MEIESHKGDSEEGWRSTVTRMVEVTGLFEEADILEKIILHLAKTKPLQLFITSEKS
ncbi:MAG: hypothetical protein IIA61_00535 [Candidatus Marinimicrobia bacterium]|nr:hypothetical protein [Candidatus Neomarinimicrobiota bacterium]